MTRLAHPVAEGFDRDAAADWFRRNRRRSRELFELLDPEVYYTRPISLRHPVVFYEGHLPAFGVNTLLRKALGRPGVDEALERLFARGIDPEDEAAAAGAAAEWPSRERVRAYVEAADEAVLDALRTGDVERPGDRYLDRAQAVYAVLEHEAMHQETLLYMWHQLPYDRKRRPAGSVPVTGGDPPAPATVPVPGGPATLGADRRAVRFGWDNEFPALTVEVAPFHIDVHNVTNAAYLEFVEAGGYSRPDLWRPADWAWRTAEEVEHPRFWVRRDGAWFWHGLFEDVPLPGAWPVYVTFAEASAYARWRGRRLPTEAEYHRAAFGTRGGEERPYAWGAASPGAAHGNFDFRHWDPVPAGSHPAGASAWGVEDLCGNGWEWTATVFDGFPGFTPMPSYPEYSADFFDGRHYVLKGASPVTAGELVRRSFRNWFRPTYPYVYASFRCAGAAAGR